MANKISRRGFIKSSLLAGAALGFGFDGLANIRVNNRFDTIIKNGVIYSGNLREPVRGDLGIKNGKISAIGDLGESADVTVDAGGKAVSRVLLIYIHTQTQIFLMLRLGTVKYIRALLSILGGIAATARFRLKNGRVPESFLMISEVKEEESIMALFLARVRFARAS